MCFLLVLMNWEVKQKEYNKGLLSLDQGPDPDWNANQSGSDNVPLIMWEHIFLSLNVEHALILITDLLCKKSDLNKCYKVLWHFIKKY